MTSLFLQSLNDVINLHAKRVVAALYNRVPSAIWLGLYSLLVLAMAVMGYHEGMGGTRRSLAVFVLVLAFSTVLALIAEGLSTKEIARHLGVGYRTIETHRQRIMGKLEIHSVAGLTRFAIVHGIISLDQPNC